MGAVAWEIGAGAVCHAMLRVNVLVRVERGRHSTSLSARRGVSDDPSDAACACCACNGARAFATAISGTTPFSGSESFTVRLSGPTGGVLAARPPPEEAVLVHPEHLAQGPFLSTAGTYPRKTSGRREPLATLVREVCMKPTTPCLRGRLILPLSFALSLVTARRR